MLRLCVSTCVCILYENWSNFVFLYAFIIQIAIIINLITRIGRTRNIDRCSRGEIRKFNWAHHVVSEYTMRPKPKLLFHFLKSLLWNKFLICYSLTYFSDWNRWFRVSPITIKSGDKWLWNTEHTWRCFSDGGWTRKEQTTPVGMSLLANSKVTACEAEPTSWQCCQLRCIGKLQREKYDGSKRIYGWREKIVFSLLKC